MLSTSANCPKWKTSRVKEGVGRGRGLRPAQEVRRYDQYGSLNWQYHFEFLNLGYAAYVTFINTRTQIFPGIPMSTLTKMVSGIDVVINRPIRNS